MATAVVGEQVASTESRPGSRPAGPPDSLGLHQLQRQLLQSISASADPAGSWSAVANTIAAVVQPLAVFRVPRDADSPTPPQVGNQPQPATTSKLGDPVLLSPLTWAVDVAVQAQLWSAGQTSIQQGAAHVEPIDGTGQVVVAAPVFRRSEPPEAIAVLCARQQGVGLVATALQAAAMALTLAELAAQFRGSVAASQRHAARAECLEQIAGAESLRAAAHWLSDRLQERCQSELTAVGLRPRTATIVQVHAIAGTRGFDRSSEFVRAMEAALDDIALQDATLTHPPAPDAPTAISLRRLCGLADASTAIGMPLRDAEGNVLGAWLSVGQLPIPLALDMIGEFNAAAGQAISWLMRAERGPLTRTARKAWRTIRRNRGRYLAITLAAVIAILLLPAPYRVRTHCELQPVTRRFVAAPYAGVLARAEVAPGDVVQADQVLARMDDRELVWELTGLEAELKHAAQQRDTAMAGGKVGEAQLARLEIERLETRRQLLEHRRGHLEIRSPLSGVVVSGDWQKGQGVPLETGQTLFEIAPLDRMVVEVAIPQEEISHARAEQPVTMRLEAFPLRSWRGKIERLHPRAELRENRSVFLAELTLENVDDLLRPGMKGRAKIASGWHPLGWNLFHRAWESMALRWGW